MRLPGIPSAVLVRKRGVSHKYYKAAEASEDAYRQVIDNAIDGGAKLVVADGYLFSQVVYEKQKEYPDVKFVLIDAAPMDEESGEVKVAEEYGGGDICF